ncbi:MAG: hypothetical protein BWY75_00725 [bacterium ADurb.Bin425]|nr:MAG: hypothetical protein BWY75_00725 [bacterium ADurb.Bin425]
MLQSQIKLHLLFKWIEIDNNDINFTNAVFLKRGAVFLAVARQDSSKDTWMKGLDPTIENLREAGHLFYFHTIKTILYEIAAGRTGGNYFQSLTLLLGGSS